MESPEINKGSGPPPTPKLTNPHNPRPSAPTSTLKLVIPKSFKKESSGGVAGVVVNEISAFSFITGAKKLEPESFPDKPTAQSYNPPQTLPNYLHLVNSYNVRVRYNTIAKKIELIVPGSQGSTDNADNRDLTIIQSLATLNGLSVTHLPSILEAIADLNPYNPVANWILVKSWDKKDRLKTFHNTLVHREDFPIELKETLIFRWLLSLVAAVLKPSGFHARGVLTLQGAQSLGKTSWIKRLINNNALAEKVIKLDHHLDASNKDSIITALSHWIVEIGELDSSFKKDIARLKGFITASEDKLRRPYARGNSEYQRRTVFCATVNDENFLVDTTGNTRWWTIPVIKIDYEHNIDMQQLFAQVAEIYESGEQWWLTREEEILLEAHNKLHGRVSLIREQLLEIMDLDKVGQANLSAMTANEILQKLDIKNPSNSTFKELHNLLREYLGQPKRINGNLKYRFPCIDPAAKSKMLRELNDDEIY